MRAVSGYVDLFGDPHDAQPPSQARRKTRPQWRGLYHDVPGTGPMGEHCRTCRHARRFQPGARVWHKCARAKRLWTSGESTDIRVAAPACSGWERAA